jgi:predicted ATPase
MRLDKLKIDIFKNLQNFSIDFDEDSQTTVLVGRNGSGKSNLLEALILIFRDLDLGEPPQFGYELCYFCRNHQIKIIAKPENPKDKIKVFIKDTTKPVAQTSILNPEDDGFEEISYSKFKQDAREKYLPRYVFGYYSGPSNRMEKHFEKHQERFYDELINKKEGDDNQPLRPLLYARLVHSQFVLLAFFTDKDPQIQKFLDEYLWIDGLDSVLFVMRQPPWNSKEGDPRFWYARGEVKDFLSKLFSLSSAPLRLKWKVPISFRKSTTLEHLYLYLRDQDALEQLAQGYANQQEFFKALESTYISELLSEVRIRVKVRKSDGSITFREMSEGEQQLLMVLGLLRFTKEDESLFLLDEPDTHLNPAWSLQYIDFLRQVVGEQITSHIIMTTHDPLTIAGLERKQVQIIQRDETSGIIQATHPEEDPRGMGIAALLTSDIYGLRSQLDIETMRLLDERRELAALEELSDLQRARLADLNKQLEGLDFSISVRDPLFQVFVKEMTLRQQSDVTDSATLTPEQFKNQKELALKIIEEIITKGEDKA